MLTKLLGVPHSSLPGSVETSFPEQDRKIFEKELPPVVNTRVSSEMASIQSYDMYRLGVEVLFEIASVVVTGLLQYGRLLLPLLIATLET